MQLWWKTSKLVFHVEKCIHYEPMRNDETSTYRNILKPRPISEYAWVSVPFFVYKGTFGISSIFEEAATVATGAAATASSAFADETS